MEGKGFVAPTETKNVVLPTETKIIVPAPETKIIVPAPEGTYVYVVIKGILDTTDCVVFGLKADEINALKSRYQLGSIAYTNGVHMRSGALAVVNSLAELGYRVISTTGDSEVIFTMQREI